MFLEKSLNPKNENKDDLDGEKEQDTVSKDELDLILDDYQRLVRLYFFSYFYFG